MICVSSKILQVLENCSSAEYTRKHLKNASQIISYVNKQGIIKEVSYSSTTNGYDDDTNDPYVGTNEDDAYVSTWGSNRPIKLPFITVNDSEQDELFFKLLDSATNSDNIKKVNRDDLNFTKLIEYRNKYKITYNVLLKNIVTNPTHARFMKQWAEYGDGLNNVSMKNNGGFYFNKNNKARYANDDFVNLYISEACPLGFIYMFVEPDNLGRIHYKYNMTKDDRLIAMSIFNRSGILRIDLEKSRKWMENIVNHLIFLEDL